MPTSVTITTGARLHFGPLSVGTTRGVRTFGGVGVMVDRPGFRIEITREDADEVDAGRRGERIIRCLESCRHVIDVPTCRIRLVDALPGHAGFGGGTQLALAVAGGLYRLAGEPVPGVEQLARMVGRGRRSAVGIHGFERGGFLVDAGKDRSDAIGALACRVELPESWRFLLITPRARGISGKRERDAFARLPPMSDGMTGRLCNLVLTRWLPAAQSRDCRGFGEAMYDFGSLVGAYFSPEQGGVYAHPRATAIIQQLQSAGVTGIAQTSWGPTLCGLVESAGFAESVARALRQSRDLKDASIRIAAPLNRGASIQCGETAGDLPRRPQEPQTPRSSPADRTTDDNIE